MYTLNLHSQTNNTPPTGYLNVQLTIHTLLICAYQSDLDSFFSYVNSRSVWWRKGSALCWVRTSTDVCGFITNIHDSSFFFSTGIRKQSCQRQDVCLETVTPQQPPRKEEEEEEGGSLWVVPHDALVMRWSCLSIARRGSM